ncbi:transglutaminase domain-containing protein [Bradyrhizobium sp. th.b2]|uniref:transglutaminase domain-containing protein n=1 Tax=Bradyrhizobium sp. th-b2 TaxID=172088 RepID=UPI0012ECACF9|nr:transglutaminase domain-containing protein [Bradyrhizobium sp. th.b2]
MAVLVLIASSSVQAQTVTEPAISKVVEQVRVDADYLTKRLTWDKDVDLDRVRQFGLALTAMNLVQQQVSSTRYGAVANTSPEDLPANDEEALSRGIGICGNQVSVFLNIATRVGLEARSLEFYWPDEADVRHSHIAAEVKISGKWAFFDVTWGTYFRRDPTASGQASLLEILSFDEAKAVPDRAAHAVTNESELSFRLQLINSLDPFDYFTKADGYLRGKSGDIALAAPRSNGGAWVYSPDGVPNHIGVSADYSTSHVGNASVGLRAAAHVVHGRIDEIGRGCVGSNVLVAAVNGREAVNEIVSPGTEKDFDLPDGVAAGDTITLSIRPKSDGATCVLVYKQIILSDRSS